MQRTRQITSAITITSRTNIQATPIDTINAHVGSEEEGEGKGEEDGEGELDMVKEDVSHGFLL